MLRSNTEWGVCWLISCLTGMHIAKIYTKRMQQAKQDSVDENRAISAFSPGNGLIQRRGLNGLSCAFCSRFSPLPPLSPQGILKEYQLQRNCIRFGNMLPRLCSSAMLVPKRVMHAEFRP